MGKNLTVVGEYNLRLRKKVQLASPQSFLELEPPSKKSRYKAVSFTSVNQDDWSKKFKKVMGFPPSPSTLTVFPNMARVDTEAAKTFNKFVDKKGLLHTINVDYVEIKEKGFKKYKLKKCPEEEKEFMEWFRCYKINYLASKAKEADKIIKSNDLKIFKIRKLVDGHFEAPLQSTVTPAMKTVLVGRTVQEIEDIYREHLFANLSECYQPIRDSSGRIFIDPIIYMQALFTMLDGLELGKEKWFYVPYFNIESQILVDNLEERAGFDMKEMKSPLNEVMPSENLGINTPFTYAGFTCSFFTEHNEDGNFASMNWLLGGLFKVWFIIPPQYADQFRSELNENYLEKRKRVSNAACVASDGCILHRKCRLFSPTVLDELDIEYWITIQEEGELIALASNAPHAGINTLNVAKAINYIDTTYLSRYNKFPPCTCTREDAVVFSKDVKQQINKSVIKLKDHVKNNKRYYSRYYRCDLCPEKKGVHSLERFVGHMKAKHKMNLTKVQCDSTYLWVKEGDDYVKSSAN